MEGSPRSVRPERGTVSVVARENSSDGKMTFRCRGEAFKVLPSETHRSICLLVRERDVLKEPSTLESGLTQRVRPFNILALCGIHVDDYLAVGPKDVVNSFFEHLRAVWKTTDPVFLNPGVNFSFLGITLEPEDIYGSSARRIQGCHATEEKNDDRRPRTL